MFLKGKVVDWPKVLLLRDKIYRNHKFPGSRTARAIFKNQIRGSSYLLRLCCCVSWINGSAFVLKVVCCESGLGSCGLF